MILGALFLLAENLRQPIAEGVYERLIFGQWQLGPEIAVRADSPLSGETVERLQALPVSFSAKLARFDTVRCNKPVYDLYYENAQSFQRETGLRFADIEFSGEQLLAVDINCGDHRVSFDRADTVYVIAPGKLITSVEGVWFRLLERKAR